MISAAVFTPPSDALRQSCSPPASTLLITSFRSFSADGLDAVERGDAHQHLVALALAERLQHRPSLVEVEVHQDRGDDLRVLVAQQLGHRAGVHPLQALDARDVAALQDAVDQQVAPCRRPSALRSTAFTYSSVSATSMLLLGRHAGERRQHARRRARAASTSSRAMVSPRRLHLFRRQVA